MEAPSTVHPTKFKIGGYILQVVSYAKLTDEQAARIAQHFYKTQKLKKKDKGKLIKVITMFDENDVGHR
jgi:hypothetical protein